jgi:glycosyltransferase 2 family protein
MRRTMPAVVAGAALFAAGGAAAKRSHMHPTERDAFAAINELGNTAYRPIWFVMQAGSLGAVGAAAGLALMRRHTNTAIALGVAGSAVWGGAKGVKKLFGRGRPADHVDGATIRGKPASGLGFPSGHAAVATTLAVVAAADLGPVGRVAVYSVAGITGLARVYVGAHLPADVVGGVGMGLAAGALTNAVRFSRAIPSG